MTEFTSRLAVRGDIPALTALMEAAIVELQRAYLDEAQIESSRAIMGIDTQLIDDGTYMSSSRALKSPGAAAGAVARLSTAATKRRAVTATCSTPRSTRPGCGRCTPIQPSPDAAWAG